MITKMGTAGVSEHLRFGFKIALMGMTVYILLNCSYCPISKIAFSTSYLKLLEENI